MAPCYEARPTFAVAFVHRIGCPGKITDTADKPKRERISRALSRHARVAARPPVEDFRISYTQVS